MQFNNNIPEWTNTGTEPSEDLRTSGFQAGQKPPAGVFNWFWSLVQKAIKEIQQTVGKTAHPVVATSTDGVAYTATIDGITELYDGLTIRILPEIVSTSTYPTLNVNGLGDYRITMLSSFNNAAAVAPSIASWLSAMRPVELTFHQMRSSTTGNVTNSYWVVEWRRPSATSLYGQTPVQNGGWYINSNTTDEDMSDALDDLVTIGVQRKITSGTAAPTGGVDGDVYIQTAIEEAAPTEVKNYIIEEGTSGIWSYRKWSNGDCELWGKVSKTVDINSAFGNLYRTSSAYRENFPFTFAEAPICNAIVTSSESANWAVFGISVYGASTTQTCSLYAARPSSSTSVPIVISYAVHGHLA